jgi:hypothetical protein
VRRVAVRFSASPCRGSTPSRPDHAANRGDERPPLIRTGWAASTRRSPRARCAACSGTTGLTPSPSSSPNEIVSALHPEQSVRGSCEEGRTWSRPAPCGEAGRLVRPSRGLTASPTGGGAMSCPKVARIRGRSTLCYGSTGREHCIGTK